MRITMIGHSTVLVEAGGKKVLTDPYFGLHGNPGYARLEPPAVAREALRDIDLVLISHNHWDHIDGRFLRALGPGVPVLAPSGRAWFTRLRGARNAAGMRPWEERRCGGVTVRATPARHVVRTIGFLIEGDGARVYFAGDTWYGDFMERIGAEYPPGAALMPVTTYRIPMTMGEREAARAARALRAPVVIPIHLGIAPRAPLLRTRHSPEGFREELARAGVPAEVRVLRPGESTGIPAARQATG